MEYGAWRWGMRAVRCIGVARGLSPGQFRARYELLSWPARQPRPIAAERVDETGLAEPGKRADEQRCTGK